MINVKPGSVLAVIATIDPQTVNNSIKYSDVVDMSRFDQVMAVAMTGAVADETLDMTFLPTDSSGTILGSAVKAIAQQPSGSPSQHQNSQCVLVVDGADMAAGGYRYGKFSLVTGASTGGPMALLALGVPKYGPAGDVDLASVTTIKQD